ncbi:multidrug resistance protein [Capsulimonas corticalis]|uniref:Multidrug resistance protein n=1 Tax=Capsulimonas corticalis TaxID=2219043 RepID=A0A402D477_9BACT|nr:MDR family MFS transporter [Capsulimonas corticalis]BDI29209.1 multidrug resistance protein [Capsulimonas corticalis]
MATTLEQSKLRAPAAPKPVAAGLNPYRWIILMAVLTGAFLELLDTTSVNVALRQMAGNFGATTDEIGWVATGYILSNVIVLPLTAWLSSVFGRRGYLTASILLFTLASFLCGASHTLGQLIFWRIIQGAGGAALLSTAQAALREVFPADQQGMIQSFYIVVIVLGPTVGPAFGGWITDNYSWQWIFWSKAPLGLVAAFLVWRFLSDSPHKAQTGGVDWAGIGLLTVGLGSLQYVLEEGQRYDWFDDIWIVRLTITAFVSLIAFVVWELWATNKQPVVNLRVLKHRALTAGCVLLFIGGAGIYAGSFLMPLFVQSILGFSPTEAGLLFLPAGVVTIFGTLLAGRLLNGANPLVKPPVLIALGLIGFSFSQWLLGHLSPQSGTPDIEVGLMLRGAGMGFLFTPITVASLSSLKGAEIPQGAGLTNLFRQLGGSFGIAIINAYVTSQTAGHRADLVGFIFSGNPALLDRVAATSHYLVTKGMSITSAHNSALGIIENTVQRQASTMAYDDAFLLLAAAFAFALPALLLFRQAKAQGAAAAPIDAGH